MPVVVYDANVLYPSTLRDVLIRIGLARLVQPKWTDRILDEVFRNLRANRPDLDPARLDRTRRLMNDAIRDVTVTGYEQLIDQLDLPDADDRHVLAATIHAEAQVIITFNLRDFPADRLSVWGVEAQHPDDFLTTLYQDQPDALVGIVAAISMAWGDGAGPDNVARPSRYRRTRHRRSRTTGVRGLCVAGRVQAFRSSDRKCAPDQSSRGYCKLRPITPIGEIVLAIALRGLTPRYPTR